MRHDLIAAVFALGGEDDLVRLLARVDALDGFLESDDGANLLIAYRRAANIVRIEEKKDGADYDGAPDASASRGAGRRTRRSRPERTAAERAPTALHGEDFAGAMAALARPARAGG